MSLKYRREIDGLRAIAVVPVILFHGGIETFSGGFVGVDIFFVVSGFLITGIIRAEMATGTFSILGFYERRARRLLPALFLVVLCCLPFAWAWMLPHELEAFGSSVAAVNLFGSNFLFWRSVGYFGASAELVPLLHTWSLAVEEQFYVFFPLLLLALRQVRANLLAVILLLLTVLSLSLAEIMLGMGQRNLAFYLLPTRAWELGIGAAGSIWFARLAATPRPLAEGLAATGLALIALAIIAYDATVSFPGVYAVVPVAGTALILLFARQDTITGRLLGLPPLVGIGLISYSAYLWHQPIFAFARIRSLTELHDSAFLALGGLSLVLGFLSWRFVENPIRRGRQITRATIFSVSGTMSAAILLSGAGLFASGGVPSRVSEQVATIANVSSERKGPAIDCIASDSRTIPLASACKHGPGLPSKAAIWGDSHANALAEAVGSRFIRAEVGITEFSYANCPSLGGINIKSAGSGCARFNQQVLEHLIETTDIETVVLASRWSFYFEASRFDNLEGGVELGAVDVVVPLGSESIEMSDADRHQLLDAALRDTVDALTDAGKRIIVIGPVPEAGWDVPLYLARSLQFNPDSDVQNATTSRSVFETRSATARQSINALPDQPQLTRLDPASVLCGSPSNDRCNLMHGTMPLYRDDDHLSVSGARYVIEEIFPEVGR